MANFVSCFAVLLTITLFLTICGIGFIAILQPQPGQRALTVPVLVAPLLGLILLTALGLARIVLLLPLQPVGSATLLVILSLALLWVGRYRLWFCFDKVPLRKQALLFVPALLFAVYFSFLFHQSGFQLLSGSEDELQYCANSTHMLKVQNTGLDGDLPVPRIDHWIYDGGARDLCYATNYRRGAEVLLASIMCFTGLSAPVAFPVLCGVLVMCMTMALGSLGLDCLRLDINRTIILQIGCAFLFYLMLLQLQGSLANLSSLPCFLCGLGLVGLALEQEICWRLTILTGLILGGAILFYPDVAAVEVIVPLGVVLFEQFVVKRHAALSILKRAVALLGVATIVSSQSAMTIAYNIGFNLGGLQKNHQANHGKPVCADDFVQSPLAYDLGVSSFYNVGPSEDVISAHFSSHLERLLPYAFVIYGFALLGFIGLGSRCRALQVAYVLLLLILPPLLAAHDGLRVARAFGYSIPYALIGLVLATRLSSRFRLIQWASSAVLAVFILTNVYTDIRTAAHVDKFSLSSDKKLRRLNPADAEWCELRRELAKYPFQPVLLSGFTDTPTPHWIITAIEPHPNFLGESITSFWHVLDSPANLLSISHKYHFKHRSKPLKELMTWDWSIDYPKMIVESVQALVPPGGHYPREWQEYADVLPAQRSCYANICDVIYKKVRALQECPGLGRLERDSRGVFRFLDTGWTPLLYDDHSCLFVFAVTYEGEPHDVTISGLVNNPTLTISSQKSLTKAKMVVTNVDLQKLVIKPTGAAVKIRSIDLLELNVASPDDAKMQIDRL